MGVGLAARRQIRRSGQDGRVRFVGRGLAGRDAGLRPAVVKERIEGRYLGLLRDAYEVVTEAVKRMPAEFRMPVVLRDLEEWSYEEISASLELPVGTVKSRISRGRGQLKALLRPLMDSGKIET